MAETSARHHSKIDFTPILNGNRPATRKPNPVSNPNGSQWNNNVNQRSQQQNVQQVEFELTHNHIKSILTQTPNPNQPTGNAQSATQSRT